MIAEADAERVRQKKELDQVISERDILGTQLVRRNDELALLYEKIKIQQSTLNKGEIQYNQRLEDIRVLKLEIKKLRREKAILQKSVANVDDLRYVKNVKYLCCCVTVPQTPLILILLFHQMIVTTLNLAVYFHNLKPSQYFNSIFANTPTFITFKKKLFGISHTYLSVLYEDGKE